MQPLAEVFEFMYRGQLLDAACFEGLDVVRLNQTKLNGRIHVVVEIQKSHGWVEFKLYIDTWNRANPSRHVEPEQVRVFTSFEEYARKNKTPLITANNSDTLCKQVEDLQRRLELATTDNTTLTSSLRSTQYSLQEARTLHAHVCGQLNETSRKLGRVETELQQAHDSVKKLKVSRPS